MKVESKWRKEDKRIYTGELNSEGSKKCLGVTC